jgi:hypothetical protein
MAWLPRTLGRPVDASPVIVAGKLSSWLHYHGSDSFGFYSALGEFRGAIGPHVAAIAVQYGIDVEDELAKVLPAADDDQKAD